MHARRVRTTTLATHSSRQRRHRTHGERPVSTKAKTTTEAGLGYEHQRIRRRLMLAHQDGAPCPCGVGTDCGPRCPCRAAGYALPMYRDPTLNADGQPLHADHTLARSQGGTKADRLMLGTCNMSRGDGHNAERYAAPWWTRDWMGE